MKPKLATKLSLITVCNYSVKGELSVHDCFPHISTEEHTCRYSETRSRSNIVSVGEYLWDILNLKLKATTLFDFKNQTLFINFLDSAVETGTDQCG